MKPIMRCNVCLQQGDGYWAGDHTKGTGHEWFAMVEEDEPPQSIMGLISRVVPPLSPLAERFKGTRSLWTSDWGICPIRGHLSNRRNFVLMDI